MFAPLSVAVLVRVSLTSLASCALVGCGGSKPPPLTADDPATPADIADDAGEGVDPPASAAADEAGTATAPPADSAPGPVSCKVNETVCSEVTLGGKDAADAKDRCKTAAGEAKDGECSRTDVVATCVVASKKTTLFYYKDKGPEQTRGILSGGKAACKNAGGAFAPTGKPAGGVGGKKRPGKKKR